MIALSPPKGDPSTGEAEVMPLQLKFQWKLKENKV